MVVSEAVAVAVEVEYDGAVQEPVEHGGGDGGVAEDLAPAGDAAVGGDHDRCFQVALRDDLKQRRRGFGGQRQVAEFVDLCRRRHRSTYAEAGTMPTGPTDVAGERGVLWLVTVDGSA